LARPGYAYDRSLFRDFGIFNDRGNLENLWRTNCSVQSHFASKLIWFIVIFMKCYLGHASCRDLRTVFGCSNMLYVITADAFLTSFGHYQTFLSATNVQANFSEMQLNCEE